MATRPPAKTVNLDGLLPPEEEGPTPDELVDLGWGEEDPGPPPGASEPRPMAPTDVVPVFRADLTVAKGAPGLFEVTDPATGRHFTLYEFELSIARMLDGRRHASDVIENGVRLGIPVDLGGLYKFVRQLWRYGFLAPEGTPSPVEPSGEGDRPEREKWDEATRTLFQTGLRLVRQGRPHDAASYFQAVLDADPDNAEAAERLAAIERGETVAAVPIGFRPAPGPKAARAHRRPARIALVAGLAVVVAAVAVAAAVAWSMRRPAPPPPPPPPPPPIVRVAPPPAWRTAAVAQRHHPVLGTVEAPDAGAVTWQKPEGAAVKGGERLGVLRVEVSARGAARIDPAAAARIRELEALAKQDPVYRDFLEKERRAAQRARPGRGVREVPLVAPVDGILTLAVAGGQRVERGAPLASVVDDAVWRIDAFVDGAPPPADAACELRGDALTERLPCRLEEVRPREGGSDLAITAPSADAPWVGDSRSLRVRVAPPGTPRDDAGEPSKQGAP